MVVVLPPSVKADDKVIFRAAGIISMPHNVEICGPLYHDKLSGLVERRIIQVRGLC